MNLALFDFDGTITTKETWPILMRSTVPAGRQVAGMALLAPILGGYRLGIVPVSTVRSALTKFGLRGVSEARLREVGQHVSRTVLPGLIRPPRSSESTGIARREMSSSS
jgi:phosphatidylglycerophosphatase C